MDRRRRGRRHGTLQEIIVAAAQYPRRNEVRSEEESRRRFFVARAGRCGILSRKIWTRFCAWPLFRSCGSQRTIWIRRSGAIRSTAAFDLRIAYGDAVDKPAEIARLKKEIDRLEKDIESKQKRLADDSFTSKAPGKVVDAFAPPSSSARSNTANFRTASTNFCSALRLRRTRKFAFCRLRLKSRFDLTKLSVKIAVTH